MIYRRAIIFLLCLGLVAVSGGCRRAKEKPVKKIEPLRAVATVYPLADVAEQVGGAHLEARWIVESGQSLVGVQPGSDVRERLLSADLVLSGGVTEPWAAAGFADPMQRHRIIRLDLLASAQQTPGTGLLWLDPVIVQDLCRELSARLTVVRPSYEPYFRERSDDYIRRLAAIQQEYEPKFYGAQTKRLLVLSSDFNPLLHRFGLKPVLAVEGLATQLSESDIAVIKYQADQNGTRLLIVPADTPEVVQRDLAVRASIQTVPLDALGSSARSGRNSYLELLRYNLDQLSRATSVQ